MKISGYLEPDIGEKGEKYMNKKNSIYSNAPKSISSALLSGEIVDDFLPPPEKLLKKESKIKITISLNSSSILFFKKNAKKNNVKYQTMINEVLNKYVQQYS